MPAVRHLEPFGFPDAALIRNGSLALGGGSASPLDMAQAYATFANGGYAIRPYVIDAIFGPGDELMYRAEPAVVCPRCEPGEEAPADSFAEFIAAQKQPEENYLSGTVPLPDERVFAATEMSPQEVIEETAADGLDEETLALERELENELMMNEMAELGESYQPDAKMSPELYADVKLAKRIITPQNAFLIQDAMRDVIRRGTGVRARRELGRADLSGKTGTSNDRRDAWFAGFNSSIVGVVWVGYDDDQPLGPREEGSRTALPIWIEFMRLATKGMPLSQMDMPEGIVTVRISKSTGCPVSASHPFDDVMFEHFRVDHVPDCGNVDAQQDIFGGGEETGSEDDLF